MAIFNLGENNEAVVLRFDEVDTIIAPSTGIDYLVSNFQTEDRIDISGISQTAQELIDTAVTLTGAVRLIGDFRQMTLIGITIDDLRPENFISNSAPSASDDFAVTTEGIAIGISVLDNDFDPNGEPISISGFPTSTGFGGIVNLDPNTGELLYQPQSNFVGADSFTYTIADSEGLTDTAVVTVNVQQNPNPNPPVAIGDSASTTEGIPVAISVLQNDFDPDGQQVLLEGVQANTNAGGSAFVFGEVVQYSPAPGFFGTDNFSYSISDGAGGTATGFVTVTVERENTAPIAVPDVEATTSDTQVTIAVLDNDINFENDVLSIVDFSPFTTGGGTVVSDGINLVYNPDLNFTGVDSFNYTITDGEFTDTGTVIVAVNMPPNNAPVATGETAFTTENIPVSIAVLDNDFDPDGDPLFIIGISATANGLVSISGNELLYNPAGFVGTDIFNYTISDGREGGTATASVTVVVEADPNRPPVAIDDFAGTLENSPPIDILVLENDFDPDEDVLQITGVSQAAFGEIVSIAADGSSVLYQPQSGFAGADSFSYTISDGEFISTATVTVDVADVNGLPVAFDDFAVTDEDTPIDIFVVNNDSDPDNDPLEIAGVSETEFGGIVSINDDESVQYTPALGFIGTDSFTYTIADSLGQIDTAIVTVEVVDINVAPVAVDDFEITDEGISVAIEVLDNDFDLDGDILEITDFALTSEFGGNVVFDNNGTPFESSDDSLVYTPQFGFTGTDSFNYTISDGQESDTGTVTVTVVDVNLPPIAQDDFDSTSEGIPVSIAVLNNDDDPDFGPQPLFISDFQSATFNGIVTSDGENLVYLPDLGFTGTDSFSYTVSDGLLSDTATVTVRVDISNPPPIAEDDEATTRQGGEAVEIAVLLNDEDPDLFDSISIVGFPTETASGGTVTIDNNGSPFDLSDDFLRYEPDADFTGTDSFTYTIADIAGATDTAIVTVEVGPQSPPIAADDSATTREGEAVEIDVLSNDSDEDGDGIAITGVETETSEGGTVTIDNNGSPFNSSDDLLVYEPDGDFTGTDSFIYTISDGLDTATATVTVTVEPINNPPVALLDFSFTEGNTDVAIAVLDNDFDIDGDILEIAEFSETTAEDGTVSLDGDELVYSPAADFSGTDSFSYTISDGQGGTDSATVTVAVEIVNVAPIAADDTAIVTAGMDVTIEVLENDSDPDGDEISLVDFAATTDNGGTITIDNGGTPLDSTDDSLVYEAAEVFTGTDSFTYTISDGELSATATVNVTVEPPENIPPIAVNDLSSTSEGIPVSIAVLNNDSDPDNGPQPLFILNFEIATDNGIVTLDGENLVYTPEVGFTGTDSFSYTISDELDVATATVSVTVDPVGPENIPPIAVNDLSSTSEGIPVSIAVLNNDSDPDNGPQPLFILDFEIATDNGIVTLDGENLVYTPEVGFTGTDSFSYTISDGLNVATATVSVTVDPVGPENIPPIAADDTAMVTEGMDVNIAVLENDSDPDNGPEDLSITGLSETEEGGTIVIDGETVVYTPPEVSETITDSFTYTISDGELTDTATVNVTVFPDNDPPIAVEDTAITTEGIAATIAVLDNDSDPNEDELSIVTADFPIATAEGGTVSLDNGGTPFNPTDDALTYEAADGFSGTDSFTYTISDGELTATATVNVTVIDPNEPPIALEDFGETTAGSPVRISVLENDFDPDGDPVGLTNFMGMTPDGGTIVLDDNGTPQNRTDDALIYTPGADFTGTDSFSYRISDGELTDTATVSVTVERGNEDPIAVDDTALTTEGIAATIAVLDNDSDPDEDPLEILDFVQTTSEEGTVTQEDDGTLVYAPATEEFVGTDSFSYTVSDGRGGTDTATVTVTVEPDNIPPIALPDFTETVANSAVVVDVTANDFDLDGDEFNVTGVSETDASGTVEIGADNQVTYTPASDFVGPDSFTYTITDEAGATGTATVSVIVAPGNADPVAMDDEATTTSGISATIMVLDNDSDPDGDPVSLEEFAATTENEGTVTLDNNGTPTDLTDDFLVYAASETFLGTDSFAYTISDGQGGTASATVTVTVEAPFDPPVANDLNVVSRQNTEVRIPVLINDESADESLTVTVVGQPDSGTGETEVVENQVVYTPGDGIGEDSFSYSISDSFNQTATAVVDVNLQPLGAPLTGSPDDDLIIGDDRLAEVPPGGGNIILETLQGQEGDDTLIGNEGADILVGGPGADEFVYLSLNDSNSTDIVGGDTVRDFNPTEDKIRLDFEIDGEQISNEDVTIGDLGIQLGTASILIEADPTFQIVLLLEPVGTIYTVGQIENSLEFGGIQ